MFRNVLKHRLKCLIISSQSRQSLELRRKRRCNISNPSDSASSGYPNIEKRVENTTGSGVFLTKFEMFKSQFL